MLNDNLYLIKKYEPKKWNNVIGQNEIISSLLKNIENKNLSKFLFFFGKEGVGKNTCANILAKSINQLFSNEENINNLYKLYNFLRNPIYIKIFPEKLFIKKNNKPNIFIFNNKNIIYPYDIYKLMKIPNSLFIFFNKKKIFEYTINNYQSFTFKNIPKKNILSHIEMIVNKEKIKIEKNALNTISKYADGSIGKAIITLNKFYIRYNNNIITNDLIIKNLGIIESKNFFIIVDYLLNENIHKTLSFIKKKFLNNEKQNYYFIIGLKKHFRNLFLSKNFDQKSSNLVKKKEVLEFYIKQSKNISYYLLNKSLQICSDLEKKYFLYKKKEFYTNIESLIEISIIQLSYHFHNRNKKLNNKKIIFFIDLWNEFINQIPKNLLSIDLMNTLINDTKFKMINHKKLSIIISSYKIENSKLSLIHKNFLKFYKNRINNLFFDYEIKIENKKNYDDFNQKNKFLKLFIKRVILNNS
ncbi:hypothetical protein [Blattabacterium cuenoti]|uniref:hypothetical protein n=1 Tax=Blattabacterium cuenoti TaxID=1653831 RepID=UPI00163B85AB|nr:hypothetical protein [Blattabacterium cuenoti]